MLPVMQRCAPISDLLRLILGIPPASGGLSTIIYERSQMAGSGESQAAGAAAFRLDRFNGSFATEDRQRRSTVCRLAAKRDRGNYGDIKTH